MRGGWKTASLLTYLPARFDELDLYSPLLLVLLVLVDFEVRVFLS